MIQIHDLGVCVDVLPGKSLSILGPSGSGKTTLLRTIAHRSKSVMLFQDLALWPHLTALEHIKLVNPKSPILKHVGIDQRQHAYPHNLSGGEKQRLALARALAIHPNALLLDEPFTSLDLPQKIEMLTLVKKMQSELQFSILHVTHDPFEALHMSTDILFLSQGHLSSVWPQDLQSAMQFWHQFPLDQSKRLGQNTEQSLSCGGGGTVDTLP